MSIMARLYLHVFVCLEKGCCACRNLACTFFPNVTYLLTYTLIPIFDNCDAVPPGYLGCALSEYVGRYLSQGQDKIS